MDTVFKSLRRGSYDSVETACCGGGEYAAFVEEYKECINNGGTWDQVSNYCLLDNSTPTSTMIWSPLFNRHRNVPYLVCKH